MHFAPTSQKKLIRPATFDARQPKKPARGGTGTSRLELFGACLMIGCFLVMAMFG